MKHYDHIYIVGNVTNDIIYEVDNINGNLILNTTKRKGGIENFQSVLPRNEDVSYINSCNEDAVVLFDKYGRKKSFVTWRYPSFGTLTVSKKDWMHISYADKIRVNLVNQGGRVSMDFCSQDSFTPSRHLDNTMELLKKANILITSDTEVSPCYGANLAQQIEWISSELPHLDIIIHTRNSVCYKMAGKPMGVLFNRHDIRPINPVGAGDVFCAQFIKSYAYGEADNNEYWFKLALEEAQAVATRYVMGIL